MYLQFIIILYAEKSSKRDYKIFCILFNSFLSWILVIEILLFLKLESKICFFETNQKESLLLCCNVHKFYFVISSNMLFHDTQDAEPINLKLCNTFSIIWYHIFGIINFFLVWYRYFYSRNLQPITAFSQL